MNELPANYRVYKNGAIFDKDKGRIVALRPELATKNTQITKENTSEMAARRLEKKRAVIAAAAAEAVENDALRRTHGDEAWIAAIAQAQFLKATTPDDPKSTDAARFLLQEAGLSDARQQPATPAEAVGDILRELAAVAREIADATRRDDADIVDGTATTHSDDDDGDGDGTRTTVGVG